MGIGSCLVPKPKQSQIHLNKPQVAQVAQVRPEVPLVKLPDQLQATYNKVGPFLISMIYPDGIDISEWKQFDNKYYRGTWNNDKPTGKGQFYDHLNKKLICGFFCQGTNIRQNARIFYQDGSYFQGDINLDYNLVYGKMVQHDLTQYIGQFHNNRPHGQGIFKSNQKTYQGIFQEGTIKEGKLIEQQGQYKGQFLQNKKNGKGQYKWKNGNIYNGNFVNDKIDGQGELTKSSGQVYKGTFNNDNFLNGSLKNDKGTYTGIFKDFQIIKGEYQSLNREYYEGQFKNSIPHGKGKQVKWIANTNSNWTWTGKFQNGSIIQGKLQDAKGTYQGKFNEGVKHGYGIYQWKNGGKYQGNFQIDYQHGYGILYDKQGRKAWQGPWEYGVRKKQQSIGWQ